MPQEIKIFSDGGSRGNPGPAACAIVIKNGQAKILKAKSLYLGETTNNQAEYQGVLLGLTEAKNLGLEKEAITFYLDSELVVKQLRKEYKVKDEGLQKLFVKAWNLLLNFPRIKFIHVRREKNQEADALLNQELDSR